MSLNRHSPDLVGKHAFLSPSKYHWVNYSDDKMERVYRTAVATRRGTELHDLAHKLISLGVKLPATNQTLNMYVNDAIGYRMTSEQVLYYSDNCYGTADTIGFKAPNKVRIHDLKTGTNEANMMQLKLYLALFCLEYHFKPSEIEAELRIYQNDEVEILVPDPMEIVLLIDRIKTLDKLVTSLKMGDS